MTQSDLGSEDPPRCQRAEEDTEGLRGPGKEAAPCSRPEIPRPLSIESVMPSSHLIRCHPLLLLPPIPPSI